MNETEIWKDIVGYEGLYQISNLGRVKSLERKNGNKVTHECIRKFMQDKNGYYFLNLSKNGKKTMFRVNRLVAQHFVKNLNTNNNIVNHINENKQDNRAENLEWMTIKQNNNYGKRNEKISKSQKGLWGKGHPISVCQIDKKNYAVIKIWQSGEEIKRCLGYDAPSINSCCNNKKGHKSVHGYYWCFEKDLNNFMSTTNKRKHRCDAISVCQIDMQTLEVIKIWDAIIQVEEELGYVSTEICATCNGKHKQSYGYYWCKLENLEQFYNQLSTVKKSLDNIDNLCYDTVIINKKQETEDVFK